MAGNWKFVHAYVVITIRVASWCVVSDSRGAGTSNPARAAF